MKLPKSSIFRYLDIFEQHGYVERIDGELFQLGIKLIELGQTVHANFDLRELALPSMRQLQEKYRETVNQAVLDGKKVVFIEILESSQSLRMAAQRGTRDLSFTPSEARQFFIGSLNLPLDEGDLRALSDAPKVGQLDCHWQPWRFSITPTRQPSLRLFEAVIVIS